MPIITSASTRLPAFLAWHTDIYTPSATLLAEVKQIDRKLQMDVVRPTITFATLPLQRTP